MYMYACECIRVRASKVEQDDGVNDDTSWNESLEDGNVSLNILLFVVINF